MCSWRARKPLWASSTMVHSMLIGRFKEGCAPDAPREDLARAQEMRDVVNGEAKLVNGNHMKNIKSAAAILSLSIALGVGAAFAQAAMVNGEVKKIDEAAGKVTLKHGPIKNLDMDEEEMTMGFRVQDPAMLKQVKVGDKVQFEAERGAAGITITKLQKGK